MILPIEFYLQYLQGLACTPGIRQTVQLLLYYISAQKPVCSEPYPHCLYHVYKSL